MKEIKLREIKFRAWDKFTNTMWNWEEHNAFSTDKGSIKQWFEDYDLIVMEYTGLKDSNGKEMYEGDIVVAIALKEYECEEELCISDIIYNQGNALGEWQVRSKGYEHGLPIVWGGWESLKVIGNIYENPELLKDKDND